MTAAKPALTDAEFAEMRLNADRYLYLRAQHWNDAPMCVVLVPRQAVRLGYECPSLQRLDDIVDASMKAPVVIT